MNKFLLLLLIFCTHLQAQNKFEVFFDFNKSDINAEAKLKLDSLLSKQKNIQITKIYGYADNVDNDKYNDSLSVKRARKIQDYFKMNKTEIAENFDIKGFGENFKQSELQSNNRKTTIYYILKPIAKKKNGSENSNFDLIDEESFTFDLSETEQTLIKKFSKAKKGDFITLENLNFHLNSEKLIKQSEPVLDILLNILKDNPKLKIEIHGHVCCNRDINTIKLSYRRSKFVFDYLIKKGILTVRLGHRGFGGTRPIYKIPEKNAAEEQANRRIEIEIKEN